jgi:hypothetical protein
MMKLTPRDIRVLQIGAVALVAIPAIAFGSTWIDDWRNVRASLSEAESKLKALEIDQAKQAGLLSIVPVCEPPQEEEVQKFLFRDKLHEQLRKAGIKTEPLQILAARATTKYANHKVLKIQCRGKCKFDQLLDLLANLKENPYLVGVEELSIKCDPKQPPDKRQEIDIELTVSTFVKVKQVSSGGTER